MVPLTIKTAVKKTREKGETQYKTYHMDMANFPLLLPQIVYYAGNAAVSDDLKAAGDCTTYVTMKFKLKECKEEATICDAEASAFGSGFSIKLARLLMGILMNPYKPVTLERVEITVDMVRELREASIETVLTDAKEAKPGENVTLKVKLKGYNKGEWWEDVVVPIPADIKGDQVTLSLEGGDSANGPAASHLSDSGTVEEMMASVSEFIKPNAFVVTIDTGTEGIRYNGRMMENLPPSVVKQIVSVLGDKATVHADVKRVVKDSDWIISGSETITLPITRKEK